MGWILYIFLKFQRGNNRNEAGKCLNSKLTGKQIFLAGHLSTLKEQCFSEVVTRGGGRLSLYCMLYI